jgi:hypothetical protein
MVLKLDLSHPQSQPCQRCGWMDDAGGVQLEDNTGTRRVFCHQCTVDLVRTCLGQAHGIAVAARLKTCLPVAGESQRQPVAKAS